MAKVTEKRLWQALGAVVEGTATPVVVDENLRQPARLALTRMLTACGQ